jgi:hypothetical protein
VRYLTGCLIYILSTLETGEKKENFINRVFYEIRNSGSAELTALLAAQHADSPDQAKLRSHIEMLCRVWAMYSFQHGPDTKYWNQAAGRIWPMVAGSLILPE